MDTIAALPSREIFATLMPTIKAFTPLLIANKDHILSIPKTTHKYGAHPRQELDLYPAARDPDTSPILINLYGGGLTRGDKTIPFVPSGLAYHNLGAFFAHAGFTTVIPDYRRVNDAAAGMGEDATFPSGADDLSEVLRYLAGSDSPLKREQGKPRDVFIMGNSAGGVHLATWLFWKKYVDQRLELLKGSGAFKLAGAILLSVPCDMESASKGRLAVNAAYWPPSLGEDSTKPFAGDFCVTGLLLKLKDAKSPAEMGIPPLLVAEDEFDPVDEILETIERFCAAWKDVFGDDGCEKMSIEGHNHISPPYALGSGDVKAEKWGRDVVKWMRKHATD